MAIDGFGAGLGQSLEQPLGVEGSRLHDWAFATKTFRRMAGEHGGSGGIYDRFAARAVDGVGAWIIGRNMFGPLGGPWPDASWRGWWGENPPFHGPVFVLTHHARPALEMEGGTVFHFVTDGPHSALARAREAAGGNHIRLGGGSATIRAYIEAGAIDALHLAQVPLLLGAGEPLFAGINLPALGYQMTDAVQGEGALHITICRGEQNQGEGSEWRNSSSD